jgi:3-hydroxyacyl-CoA dehydrogenase
MNEGRMTEAVSYIREANIAVITVDNPPVNALSQAVRAGILENIQRAEADGNVAAALIICAGRTFIAGADITEFGKPPLDPLLPNVLAAVMASSKIVVVALHGTALGGGFEVALAGHYRAALASAKVGLPEVNLGILPGAGGTQRLPRLIGVDAALSMILSAKPIGAAEAVKLGIIDHLVEGPDLRAGALEYTRSLLAKGAAPRRIDDMTVDKSTLVAGYFDTWRQKMACEKRGFFAPQKCIDAVEAAVNLPIAEGLKRERALFLECMATTQSKAQRYAFFAERQVSSVPGIGKEIAPRPLLKVGVVGAGTIGGGIAMNFANAGIPVTIVEANAEALARGFGLIAKNYSASAAKGKISAAKAEALIEWIKGSLDYGDLADADLVIEAAFENMDIKKQIFSKLDALCKPGAILASNTSTLDVNEIAAVTGRPQDVLGLHFFSPAHVMRLLEIVRGAKTANEVLATALAAAKAIGKIGVVSGVCDGFIGNRMLDGYLREACLMLLEGATPAQVDKAIYDFGMAMGPFAMIDMAGVDVGYLVRVERRKAGKMPEDPLDCLAFNLLYAEGRFGQKSGKGFYRYDADDRTPRPDMQVEKLMRAAAVEHNVKQKSFTDAEIVARCIYPLINEGAHILDEGIALRPGDIDTVWLNGYDFPVYRGGPMFYAGTVGLKAVYDRVKSYATEYGPLYWTPSPLLERLALVGKSFADWKPGD